MITTGQISIGILTFLLILILFLCFIDYIKKRKLKYYPFLSFIVPCYNDGKTAEEALRGIYNSYNSKKFEIFVINDKSKDDSLEILKKLQKKYSFKLINNKINLGKAGSINRIIDRTNSEIVIIVDGDTIINKRSLEDVLARLQHNDKVGAVSVLPLPKNKGFLGAMQSVEMVMNFTIQAAYNVWSSIGLWGGFMGFKKQAFKDVNGFSENSLAEDMDFALKIYEHGWKAEQSFSQAFTYMPDNLKWWFKQKTRWTAGGMQNIIKHFRIWIKNPIHIIFTIMYYLLNIFFIISLVRQVFLIDNIVSSYEMIGQTTTFLLSLKIMGVYYGSQLAYNFLRSISFSFFSLPYTFFLIKKPSQIFKILYIVPFALFYYPIYSIVAMFGLVKGAVLYAKLENKKEGGWRQDQ